MDLVEKETTGLPVFGFSSASTLIAKQSSESMQQFDNLQHVVDEMQVPPRCVQCDGCKLFFVGEEAFHKHNRNAFIKVTGLESSPIQDPIGGHNSSSSNDEQKRKRNKTKAKPQKQKIFCMYCARTFPTQHLWGRHQQVCPFRMEFISLGYEQDTLTRNEMEVPVVPPIPQTTEADGYVQSDT